MRNAPPEPFIRRASMCRTPRVRESFADALAATIAGCDAAEALVPGKNWCAKRFPLQRAWCPQMRRDAHAGIPDFRSSIDLDCDGKP